MIMLPKKMLSKIFKKTVISLITLTVFLGMSGLPVQAGVPYIYDVYYVSPVNMYVEFSESMNTTTIAAGDFEISTEIAGDNATITAVQFSTNNNANDSVLITASGAGISPSMSDYMRVIGEVKSATGDDFAEDYPWTPFIPHSDIKISEIQVTGSINAKDEFIEIYNRSNGAVNLNGYKLTYANATTGAETTLIADFGDVTIPADGGYYLVANAFYTGISPAADQTYVDTIDILSSGTIILYGGASDDNRVLDLVGFGSGGLREGNAAGSPLLGESIERKAQPSSDSTTMASGGGDWASGNAYDSDNNSYDFVSQVTTNPKNSSSAVEAPQGAGGNDTGLPMIMHMGLWQAKIGQNLTIMARTMDAETPSNALTASLYYLPHGGAWASVSGVHIASGFFKFAVPASAVADANGFNYYLKASDGTNCSYMSGDPSADVANSGTCPGSEPTDIQDGAWQVSGNVGGAWTNNMQGHVYESDCTTIIQDALVFAEGTGFSDLTDVNGTFDLTGLYTGSYNLVAVAPGFSDQAMPGVEADAQWPTFCMYSGSGGSGGDMDKPRVIWSAPMEGMMGAPVDISLDAAPIHLAFDKQLDSTTIDSTNVLLKYWDGSAEVTVSGITAGYYEPGDVIGGSWSASDYLIFLSSETLLDFGKDYMIIITPGVKDIAGNSISSNDPMGGYRVWFNTGYDMGTGGSTTFVQGGGSMPPFVIGSVPRPGMFDVSINSKMFIKVTEPLESTSLTADTIQLWKLDSSLNEVTQDSGVAITLEPNSKELIIVTPSANLVPNTNYRVKVRGDVQSTNGMCLAPACATDFVFTMEFKTTESSSPDSGAPTVTGCSLSMHESGGSITGVPVSLGNIEIFFSENVDPTRVNSTNIYLKAGTSEVSGDTEYDPMSKAARFYPSTALVPNTSYVLTIKGSTGGIRDACFPGVELAADQTYSFTTGGADGTDPKVMFGAADDFRIAITFSEPMNESTPGQPLYANSVINKNNYSVQYKGPTDVAFLDASAEAITYLTVKYDDAENTAMLEGLDLYDHRAHDFKITVANVKDRSGNSIDTSNNVAIGIIQDSADTGGMMGPGGGGMMGPTGGGMDFMQFGMQPCGAWPMNMMEGMTSQYFIDLPTSVALNDGDQILLTFPSGFGVSGVAPVSTNESQMNSDFNDFGPNTVTFDTDYNTDGVKAEGQTVTIQLAINGTGVLPADDFLHFELKGIKNGLAQGTDTINSEGYSVTIKTKRPSTGAILENFSTMPFYIIPGGDLTINGTVTLQGGSSISCSECVTVYIGSPMSGPMEQIIDIASGSGTYSFSNIPSGDYHIFTIPFMTVGGTDFLGDPMPKNIWLSASNSPLSQNITIKEAGGSETKSITVRLKGTFKTGGSADTIDIFAGSHTMMGEGGFTVRPNITPGPGENGICSAYTDANCSFTLYLPTTNESTWHIGIGPAMPMGAMHMGPPAAMDWWPPTEQNVYIDSEGTINYPGGGSSVDISITSAGEKIIGYVYDGKADGTNDLGTSNDYGTPVKGVDVDAHRREGFGMPAHTRTDADGKFTLSVTAGTLFLNTWFPGMPPSPEKKIVVKDENSLTDGNADSDIYINGSIPVTTVSPLVFKLGKGGYTISGTVSDGSNPAGYVPVWAWNESTGQDIPGGTDSSGNFTLYVSEGIWKVQANIPGKGDVPPETVTIPTSETDGSKRNLLLKPIGNPATISGTVSVGETGQGWAHIWVKGTDSNGDFFENGVPTRPDGTYSLSVPAGTGYTLHCFIPEYGEQVSIAIGSVTAGQSFTGQNFSISTGSLATLTFVFNNTSDLSGSKAWVDVFNASTRNGQGQEISDIDSVQNYETLKVPAGDYQIRAHIPGFGEYSPTTPVPDSVTNLITISSGASTITFNLPTTTYSVSGLVYIDVDNSGDYSATGTDTLITDGFVWLSNWESGFNGGDDIDSTNGTYSIRVPGGAGSNYYLGVDVSGYTGPAPLKISGLTSNLANQNLAVSANDKTISGQITDSSGNAVPYAWIWADRVDVAYADDPSLATYSGHNHAESDKDGNYTLTVNAGYWWVQAAGPGFQDTRGTSTVNMTSDNTATYNLILNVLSGYQAVAPKMKNIKPSEGGVIDDIANTGVKITIPATALGDGTDYGKFTITKKTGGGTNSQSTLGNIYYDISAVDSGGSPISGPLNLPLEVEIHYDEDDLPTGFEESQLTFASMAESGGWQEDMFTVDAGTNIIRVKLDHLSTVATTYPSDSDRPTTPGTPSVTAGDGQVALAWVASTDNVSVAGYEVYRSTASDGTFTNVSGDCESGGSFDSSVLVTGLTYTDSTAENGTTYYYKATAYDTSGNASANPSGASAGALPESEGVDGGGGGGGGYTAPIPDGPSTDTGEVTASTYSGGSTTLTNTDGGGVSVSIPAAAISTPTTFTIETTESTSVASSPTGLYMIAGQVYQMTAVADGNSVNSFDSSLILTFTYTDEQISNTNEDTLQVYYYDSGDNVWVALDTTIDAENNTATTNVIHFTDFALMGEEGTEETTEEGEEAVGEEAVEETPISEMSIEELEAKIVELLAHIETLKAELAKIMGETVYEGVPSDFTFETNFKTGVSIQDVVYLKAILDVEVPDHQYWSGSRYYGPKTQAAVKTFQEKYTDEILASWGLTEGTGYVGTTTRAQLNALLGQ